MTKSSIWPLDRTLLGATTSGLSGSGSDGNEYIPQSPSITDASASDCLVSYIRTLVVGGEFYPSAEMQLVYSIAKINSCLSHGS